MSHAGVRQSDWCRIRPRSKDLCLIWRLLQFIIPSLCKFSIKVFFIILIMLVFGFKVTYTMGQLLAHAYLTLFIRSFSMICSNFSVISFTTIRSYGMSSPSAIADQSSFVFGNPSIIQWPIGTESPFDLLCSSISSILSLILSTKTLFSFQMSAQLPNQKMSTYLKTDLVGNVIFSSSSEMDFVSVDFNISETAF